MSQDQKPTFSGFEIKRLLGVGATAEVYRARKLESNRDVALKVFSAVVSRDQDVVDRLQAEAELLARLRHPNVVSTYGVQSDRGMFAIELELVEGADLRQWMEQYQTIVPLAETALWITAQVARGLGAAHEIGALHRDLKPENVLISKTGDVKITDFGLARTVTRVTMTRVGLLVGSLGYLAPEVVNGERASNRSDIFSLGVLAYELLAGRPPFVGETPQALIQKLSQGIFTSLKEAAPHLGTEVSSLIDSCLARDPMQRPATVWEVEAGLMTCLSQGPLLRFAKTLVAFSMGEAPDYTDESGRTVLDRSLALKREHIIASANPGNRATTLAEFHRLFQGDSGLGLLIERTTPISTGRKFGQSFSKRRGAFAGGAVACLAIAVYGGSSTCSSVPSSPIPTSTAIVGPAVPAMKPTDSADTAAAIVSAPAKVPTQRDSLKRVALSAAPAKTDTNGTLQFEVPEDVNVYVANVLVPRSELSAYKIAAGRYPMRMVKEGFLPIEGTVDVKVGRVAVVRAGGSQ